MDQSLEQRIRRTYESMSTKDRQLADIVLEFPGDVVMLSATELAEKAVVSKAAVSRFVRRLGYVDFKEVRTEIRAAQVAGEPIFFSRSDLLELQSSDALQHHLENDISNLNRTLREADAELIERVSNHIVRANRVWCMGFRNSNFFAGYIRRQLVEIRRDVTLLPTPGQTLGEDLSGAGSDDLVIIVGLRRRTRQLQKVMQVLHARKVPILYFTDRHSVTTAKFASYTFTCAVGGSSMFDSYVGLISLLNFVCTKTAAAAGSTGRENLYNANELLDDLDEIDPEN